MKMRSKSFKIYMVALFFCALFSIGLKNGTDAKAATTMGYKFLYAGNAVETGEVKQLGTPNAYLRLTTKDDTEALPASATVTFFSTEPSVVTCEETSDKCMTKLVRKGPGYAEIFATVTIPNEDSGKAADTFTIMLGIKVGLEFTNENFSTIDWSGNQIIKLDEIGKSKQAKLKFVKYVDTDDGAVFEDNTQVDWSTTNPFVATVDEYGNITAVGAGYTEVIVTTRTVSPDSTPLQVKQPVIVAPVGSFTEAENYVGYRDRLYMETRSDNFMIYMNSQSATNLVWKVYQLVTVNGNPTEKELNANSDLLTYSINE